MLKLYCSPNSISAAVVAVLNEGVHWEPIRVDFKSAEQTKPEYLKINPKGRVPVLLTPEGPLTETGAILEYLGETVIPDLVPIDPLARARMREVMFYLASTMHVNHAHRFRGYRWADQESSFADMAAKVPETMAASADYIEGVIAGPLLFGETPTLADFYLYAMVNWLEGDGVDTSNYPKILAFRAAMKARPSIAKTHADGYFR